MSAIAESWGKCKKLPNHFPTCLYYLTTLPATYENSGCSTPFLTPAFPARFHCSHSSGCVAGCRGRFTVHFPNDWECEHLFVCFWPFVNCPLKSLVYFYWVTCFLLLSCGSSLYILDSRLCQLHVSQDFLPECDFSFHILHCVFERAEVFLTYFAFEKKKWPAVPRENSRASIHLPFDLSSGSGFLTWFLSILPCGLFPIKEPVDTGGNCGQQRPMRCQRP